MGLIKDFFKSIFKPEEYEREKDAAKRAKWRVEEKEFYKKAQPVVEKYLGEKGYEYFTSAEITIDGKEYSVGQYGVCENQIHKIISERFQIENFGEIIFEENHDFSINDSRGYCLTTLDYISYQFGFCRSKFYLEKRNPYLKFLKAYHKLNPEVKITDIFLLIVEAFFEGMAELFVYDKYGDDYYDKPGRLSEDERRDKAWSDERLHDLLDDLSNPDNPDNAALFAKNIEECTANLIIKYEYCEYEDRYEIFFGSKESKELLPASEIERRLDSKEE